MPSENGFNSDQARIRFLCFRQAGGPACSPDRVYPDFHVGNGHPVRYQKASRTSNIRLEGRPFTVNPSDEALQDKSVQDESVHGESVSFDPEVSGPKGRMSSYGRLLVGLAYAFWSVCPYRSYDFRQTWGSAEAEHSMNSMAVERRA